MKRVLFTIAFAFTALFVVSNSGTNAVSNTFAERFMVDGKPGKMGDSGIYNSTRLIALSVLKFGIWA